MSGAFLYGWDAVNGVWVKLVCNAAGKLIIDPTEIFEDVPTDNEHGKAPTSNWAFDHKAAVAAHHARYTDAEARAAVGYNGTKHWSCPGNYFDAKYPGTDYIEKHSEGYVIVRDDDIHIRAGVLLPHGAVVTSVVVKGNAGAQDSAWYLRRIRLSDKSFVEMATANVNTADTTVASATIDNSLYAYFFTVTPLMIEDEIYGATITYTIEGKPPLGPATECIRNGDFDVNDYWAWTAYWQWIDNKAYYTDVLNTAGLIQVAGDMLENVQANQNYVLKFNITSPGYGRMAFCNSGTVVYINYTSYNPGSYELHFTTPADVQAGGFQIRGATIGATFYIDNISLKRE